MTTLELVGVFRKCEVCKRWLRVGSFSLVAKGARGHTCQRCATVGRVGRGGLARTLEITPAGRAALREAGL